MRSCPCGSHHNDGPDDHHADAQGLDPEAPFQRDPEAERGLAENDAGPRQRPRHGRRGERGRCGAGSPPRQARDREESHRGDPAEQEEERAEVPTDGVAARPPLVERDRIETRAEPLVGNETANDESGRTSKYHQIPDPQPRRCGVAFRNAVGLPVAAEVFIDLFEVFALGILIVG
jgi:hypothetical protein